MKRYGKANLNMFLTKKNLMMTNYLYRYVRFFMSKKTYHLKCKDCLKF